MMGHILSVVDWMHRDLSMVLKPGDKAIDATCGNGNDILYIAGLLGDRGHVYGFDIQEGALRATREKLCRAGWENRATLFHSGHEKMADLVERPVKAIVFNLGYLPGGDRSIATNSESTLRGIESGLTLLKNGGVLFIALYWGHEEGRKEKEQVLPFVRGLPKEKWAVMEASFPNREMAPYLIEIESKMD